MATHNDAVGPSHKTTGRMEKTGGRDTYRRPVFIRLRRMCLSLPGTMETNAWGHPNFRIAGKAFCTFEVLRGRPSVAFRLGAGKSSELAETGRGLLTPYGRGQWASIWLDSSVDWEAIGTFVEASYRGVAPKRYLKSLQSGKCDAL